MTLSILISSRRDRKVHLDQLLAILIPQLVPVRDQVELIINRDAVSTRLKRIELLKAATGKYIWFINDGDWIAEYAIAEVLSCAQSDCDVMGINGVVTTNAKNPVDFQMRLEHEHPSTAIQGDSRILLKPVSYVTPIKREIAVNVPFRGRIADWPIREHLKTQEIITKPIYHFRHWT